MPKQEILPPQPQQRNQVTRMDTQTGVPGVNMGNFIDRTFSVWSNNGQSRAIDALANRNRSEVTLFRDQTAVVHAGIGLADALALARDTPERHDHELALRRLHREDGLNEAVHTFKQNVLRRVKEMEFSEADVLTARSLRRKAEVVLVDAEQQLQAQTEFGGMKYVLQHKKAALEIMDVELDMEERKKLLRDYLAKGTEQPAAQTDDLTDAEIDDALQDRLQRLMAKGLDTTNIEAAIAKRRQR